MSMRTSLTFEQVLEVDRREDREIFRQAEQVLVSGDQRRPFGFGRSSPRGRLQVRVQ